MNWIACIFIILLGGCQQKPQETHYTEVVDEVPQIDSLPTNVENSSSQKILTWVTPQGWREQAGTQMRMASFHQITDPHAIDCYIIALAGPAGGLSANLGRWSGQLGIQASDENMNQLSTSAQELKTKDGLEIKVFDFTALQTQGGPLDKSMLAAMIPVGQTTFFVKMTGSIEAVKQNKDNFLKLLGSIVRQ